MTAGIRTSTPLDALDLSERAREACIAAGARTVGDLLVLQRDALPEGEAADRLWRQIRDVLDAFSESRLASLADPRPLAALIDDRRARKAFDELGITTVGEFFATPKDRLLAVPGFGPRSYERVFELIQSCAAERDLTGLPPALLQLSITGLRLPEETLEILTKFDDATVADVLARPADVWERPGVLETLSRTLDKIILNGLDDAEIAPNDHCGAMLRVEDVFDRWYPELTALDRALVRSRLGLHCRPTSLQSVALRWNVPQQELADRENCLRESLLHRAAKPLMRMRVQLGRDLDAFDGLISCDQLAAGSLARSLGRHCADTRLPLQLAAFVFPDRFSVIDDRLTVHPTSMFRRVLQRVQRVLRGTRRLPIPLEDLIASIEEDLGPVPRSVLVHTLRHRGQLAIRMDPERGELVDRERLGIDDRLERILRERRGPATLDDLVFAYRDRFGATKRVRVIETLRGDGRFLAIGSGQWDLRETYIDELELTRAEAERLATMIQERDGQHQVRHLSGDDVSERCHALLVDLLRRDPNLRDLGRGVFCARHRRRSSLVRELCRQLKRAMGEVPTDRFVQNQPERQRRLTIRLLERNRLFVSPCEGRIDLIENYPFNPERLRRLMNTVDVRLEQEDLGYAATHDVLASIQESQLGGSFLTTHMLVDLLRRHGNNEYEILANDRIIARTDVGLSRWIQKQARSVIRELGRPMSPQEVMVQRPELGEFADAIAELMAGDPMLASEDGVGFRVV